MKTLGLKTIITNKDTTKEQDAVHNQKIQKWLEDISKVKYCKELLDVATQCENLKIIFDFEAELVSRLGTVAHASHSIIHFHDIIGRRCCAL